MNTAPSSRSLHARRGAFTIVELLVVISIIAVLIGLLLPAVNNARSQAKLTQSQSNLRNLGAAHANYASTWDGRQFTLTRDDISSYGDTAESAVANYIGRNKTFMPDGTTVRDKGEPPPVELGWGGEPGGSEYRLRVLRIMPTFKKNYVLLEPIAFRGAWGSDDDIEKFGYFRMPNARQFSQYLSGRFYDPVFYAPKDTVVMDMQGEAADLPNEFTPLQTMRDDYGWTADDFCYSSYSLSPAGLFSPDVMSRDDPQDPMRNGWRDPWTLDAGFRAPAMSQAAYPDLKTHMLEHHWLQNARSDCNPNMPMGNLRPYDGCQPYFFNQSWDSTPATLFYDGHIGQIGTRQAERADGRIQAQGGAGLWSRDTPFGVNGYWIELGYDEAATSFHILTTDGIRGRDIASGS